MARTTKPGDPIDLISLVGLRRLLGKLLAGRVERDGLRRYASELKWPHATLHKRLADPQSLTWDETHELLNRFKIKLFVNIL